VIDSKTNEIVALGRRKRATARVRIKPGSGKFEVNGRSIADYLARETLVQMAVQPLDTLGLRESFDIRARCADLWGKPTRCVWALLAPYARMMKTYARSCIAKDYSPATPARLSAKSMDDRAPANVSSSRNVNLEYSAPIIRLFDTCPAAGRQRDFFSNLRL